MGRMSTSSAAELLVLLRRDGPGPLHRQLEHELREAIRSGRLAADATLPSTRSLAAELGVSRGVTVEAYEQLAAEGYLVTRPGAAARVATCALPTAEREQSRAATAPALHVDLRPGRPDLDLFPREAWLRSMRKVLSTAPSHSLGYLDGRGVPELREVLASYLGRVRGTSSRADDVVITAGFTQGLGLVAAVLAAAGVRRVAVEDPTLPESRLVIEDAGAEAVTVPVDEAGLRVDLLAETDVGAVVVTPAHHYPTGAVLAADRRAALLEWARRTSALIVEDDYDAEFRYDRQPVGALQGLAPDRVVYAGTTSKVLAPGLRLGWLVAPPELAPSLAEAKLRADLGSPAIEQLCFADFVDRGELGRHLRRMRPVYRDRRDALLRALRQHLPELTPVGASAGLHVLCWLPPGLDPSRVVDVAAADGISLAALAPAAGRSGGIIFGYGVAGEEAIVGAIERLAAAVRRLGVMTPGAGIIGRP